MVLLAHTFVGLTRMVWLVDWCARYVGGLVGWLADRFVDYKVCGLVHWWAGRMASSACTTTVSLTD